MEIINNELSPETKLTLSLSAGKLSLGVEVDTKGLDSKVSVGVDSDYFIDKLAELIPGKVDDAIFQVLKAALKSIQ